MLVDCYYWSNMCYVNGRNLSHIKLRSTVIENTAKGANSYSGLQLHLTCFNARGDVRHLFLNRCVMIGHVLLALQTDLILHHRGICRLTLTELLNLRPTKYASSRILLYACTSETLTAL
jgi:hypothetical protein